MIRSKLPEVKRAKELKTGDRITYEELTAKTKIAASTLSRLMGPKPVGGIDGNTISQLCSYFECQVGDLLEYVPDEKNQT